MSRRRNGATSALGEPEMNPAGDRMRMYALIYDIKSRETYGREEEKREAGCAKLQVQQSSQMHIYARASEPEHVREISCLRCL